MWLPCELVILQELMEIFLKKGPWKTAPALDVSWSLTWEIDVQCAQQGGFVRACQLTFWHMCGCLGKPTRSRWGSFRVVSKTNVNLKINKKTLGMRTLVGAWWWSGEVLVSRWPAFEVKFHRYFSYFWYLYAIFPKIAVTKSGLAVTTDIQHVVSRASYKRLKKWHICPTLANGRTLDVGSCCVKHDNCASWFSVCIHCMKKVSVNSWRMLYVSL
jgi:hypothetical protein